MYRLATNKAPSWLMYSGGPQFLVFESCVDRPQSLESIRLMYRVDVVWFRLFSSYKHGSVRFVLARASRPPPRKSTKSPFVTCSCQWCVAYLRNFIYYRSLASDNDLALLGSQALKTFLQYRRRVPYNTFPSTFDH